MFFQAFLKGADSYILGCFFQDAIRTSYFCPNIDSPKRCASSGDLRWVESLKKQTKIKPSPEKKKTQKRLTSKTKKNNPQLLPSDLLITQMEVTFSPLKRSRIKPPKKVTGKNLANRLTLKQTQQSWLVNLPPPDVPPQK